MITHSGIDPLFLDVWLKVHRFENDQLNLRTIKSRNSVTFNIGNETVTNLLETDFQDFQSRKCSIETYFDIDILFFKENGRLIYNPVKRTPMTRSVVIVCKNKKGKLVHKDLSDLKSDFPLEMSLKSVFSIFGIYETVPLIPNHQFNLDSIEEKYKICVELYKKNGNMCQLDYDLPGIRYPSWEPKHRIRIAVDNLDIPHLPRFYWIPSNQLISTEYFCTRMPGICGYSTLKLDHLQRHEETCSDETTIESKQVIWYFNIGFDNIYRFFMVYKMINSTK